MTTCRIDLFSDTATQPTPGMLRAMCEAPLGDEQRGTDPTVKRLEAQVAELLGMEAAVFLPSATLANQIAVMLHCRPGDELLCHQTAHVFNNEGGGTAGNCGVQTRPLAGDRGVFDAAAVQAAIRADDPHHAITRMVVVENTSNGGGGSVWPDDAFLSVAKLCETRGLRLHIDGARLFNACAARSVEPTHWTHHVDTAQLCFSKGLGCAFGAVLALSDGAWESVVRRHKQRMGGALRQAGVAAAAMIYALDHHRSRLHEDHARAARLAEGLRRFEELLVDAVETNLVYARVRHGTSAELAARLRKEGIAISFMAPDRIRACTHLGITDRDVDEALAAFGRALRAAP